MLYARICYEPDWLKSLLAVMPRPQQQRAQNMRVKRLGQYLSGRALLLEYAKRAGVSDIGTHTHIEIQEREGLGPLFHINGQRLQISISHTAELALVAFSNAACDTPVGVDIEGVRDNWSNDKVSFFCCDAEIERGFVESTQEQKNEFFTRCWARKEALTKYHESSVLNQSIRQANLLNDAAITDFTIEDDGFEPRFSKHMGALYRPLKEGESKPAWVIEKVNLSHSIKS